MATFDVNDVSEIGLDQYLSLVNAITPVDKVLLRERALTTIRYYKGDDEARKQLRLHQTLEDAWYASLKAGKPDYSIYASEHFLTEAWACWVVYSRKYIRAMQKLHLENVNRVVDLGCGIGYSTAALKSMFYKASVVGTQVKGPQFQVAEAIGRLYTFLVVENVVDRADLIFASEYFEHFQRPVEHLEDVLAETEDPRYLVIANSFGSTSIGHFNVYLHENKSYMNYQIGRVFNDVLRARGYEQVVTPFWNNRPNVWRKK